MLFYIAVSIIALVLLSVLAFTLFALYTGLASIVGGGWAVFGVVIFVLFWWASVYLMMPRF